ncbi:hypothetical protein K437DRAFT_125829 [Tilletiaria anomala UBC 951]|uniref:PHD-type domain-containing protein n=1 Tax=Tilletiaria anomala (strain ATCC 24038 / CBS 436.72 / UBC 951) TaxID=1037660 RepID=A0A066VXR7_TILAU|nr:uncharacterized protein K437DRAFT_125829 [Tilletiaria anomala UBC 951]KDN45083.1 hypothetical protein K437DRAFT_125829 [Tilletiaria anomala UBC 951]
MSATASTLASNPLAPLNAATVQPILRPTASVSTVAFRDGRNISINDFIYISPPWSPGAGEPYLIGRVMEFVMVPADLAAPGPSTGRVNRLHVRANLFLRSRDISLRINNDQRLVVATMNAEIFSLENIRGTCEVRHRDHVGDGSAPDLAIWKKQEGRFYFHQLYDRYIHRFYDIIPTEKLRNAPAEVLEFLRNHYSFIIAEPGMQSELCDALRGCATCKQWASSPESVRCDTCKQFWHMRCLNPPLSAKPAKGYSWTCAPCTKKHELAVEEGKSGSSTSLGMSRLPGSQGSIKGGPETTAVKAKAGWPKGRARTKINRDTMTPEGSLAPQRVVADLKGTRCFNKWPYRYFGQHTDAMDVLDPYDSIYPRATTRLGVKFQTDLLSWEEQLQLGKGERSAELVQPVKHEGAEDEAKHVNGGGTVASVVVNGQPLVKKIDLEPLDSQMSTPIGLPPPGSCTTLASATAISSMSASTTPSEQTPAAADIVSFTSASSQVSTKRKPGRPAKNRYQEGDGSAANVDYATQSATPITDATPELAAQAPSTIITVKRKPGRPRKSVFGEDGAALEGPSSARGSPAPAVLIPPPSAPSAADSMAASPAPEGPFVPVRRKPGRPPKKQPSSHAASPAPGASPAVGTVELPNAVPTTSSLHPPDAPEAAVAGAAADIPDLTPVPDTSPLPNRGSDETVEVVFSPELGLSDKLVGAFLRAAQKHMTVSAGIDEFNVDLMNRALMLLCRHKDSVPAGLAEFTKSSPQDLRITTWTAREIKALEAAVREAPLDLKYCKKLIPSKKYGDLVRAFYAHKGRKYGAIWEAKRKGNTTAADELERPHAISRAVSPSLSIIGGGGSHGVLSCTLCQTTKSSVWYKGPYVWPNRAMCVDCGLHWRKYAVELNTLDAITSNKRPAPDDSGLGVPPPKAAKTKVDQQASNKTEEPSMPEILPPPPRPEPTKCTFCKKLEPKKKLVQCANCSMSVHQGCYGCSDDALKADQWFCDACGNERYREHLLSPYCILCPLPRNFANVGNLSNLDKPLTGPGSGRGRKPATSKESSINAPPPLTPLEVMKPTEYHNWVHILCSIYIAECLFSNTETLSLVEGASNLPPWRYSARCEICGEVTGACVSCAEQGCRKTFHVSCAYAAQPFYLFGFEIKPVKSVRRDQTATVSFKSETGNMKALIWCQDHKDAAKAKTLYDMSETDPATGLTALQAFARTHKHLTALNHTHTAAKEVDSSFALLRRARRADATVGSSSVFVDESMRATPRGAVGRSSRSNSHTGDASTVSAEYHHDHDHAHAHLPPLRRCCKCGTPYSPYWWTVPDSGHGVGESDAEEQGGKGRNCGGSANVCCNRCKPEVFATVQDTSIQVTDPLKQA